MYAFYAYLNRQRQLFSVKLQMPFPENIPKEAIHQLLKRVSSTDLYKNVTEGTCLELAGVIGCTVL